MTRFLFLLRALTAIITLFSLFEAKCCIASCFAKDCTLLAISLSCIVSWPDVKFLLRIDLLGQWASLVLAAICIIKFDSKLLQLLYFWHQVFIGHLLEESSQLQVKRGESVWHSNTITEPARYLRSI